jgi:hypothetical protein
MNPKDFGVRGTKVKVALTLYFKMVFYQELDNPKSMHILFGKILNNFVIKLLHTTFAVTIT